MLVWKSVSWKRSDLATLYPINVLDTNTAEVIFNALMENTQRPR